MSHNSKPWYRQPWLLLVLAPPLASVILGVSLVVIATRNSDSMVVGEYAKVGTAMNMYLGKEAHAAELGVQVRLHLDGDGVSAVLQGLPVAPERLQLQLAHPTHAERDLSLELERNAAGVYRAETTRWSPGRWYVRVEPADGDWRLSGELTDGRQELNLSAASAVN